MFDLHHTRIAGRQNLGLPLRGRLDREQQSRLTAFCKKAFVSYLTKAGVIAKTIGTVAYKASFPVNDMNFMNRDIACKRSKITPSKYRTNGGPALESLLNLEFHDGVQEIEEDPIAVAAKPSDGLETRGRKPGSKNRDKATIEAEKAAKAIRSEARSTLGLPARGRLTTEQQEKLDKYIAENA